MQIIFSKKFKQGDTIVESMFAFAIFGLVAMVVTQMMQHGARINQMALEVNLAREQITAQAEMLRLANTSHVSEYIQSSNNASLQSDLWRDIASRAVTQVSTLESFINSDGTCAPAPPHAFVLDPNSNRADQVLYHGNSLTSASTFPRLTYQNSDDDNDIDRNRREFRSAEGIWVEAVRSGTVAPGLSRQYYDFIIRTCWQSMASPVPTTLETLVRLYAP